MLHKRTISAIPNEYRQSYLAGDVLKEKKMIHIRLPPAIPLWIEKAKREVTAAGAMAWGRTTAICDKP